MELERARHRAVGWLLAALGSALGCAAPTTPSTGPHPRAPRAARPATAPRPATSAAMPREGGEPSRAAGVDSTGGARVSVSGRLVWIPRDAAGPRTSADPSQAA